MPYAVMAVILVILALWIRRSALPDIDMDGEEVTDTKSASKTSVFQYPHLLLGALCIFTYVGAEVMAGDVIGTYGKNLGFSLDQAKYFTSFTLIAMLAGYIIGIVAIPKYISQQNFLKYSAILGVVLTILVYFTTGSTAVTFIALLGLANAVMWPAIFPLAINGLGKFTQIGSAILIMGIAGGAVLPQAYGLIEESLGYQAAFLISMLLCYLFIFYYAVKGYKPR